MDGNPVLPSSSLLHHQILKPKRTDQDKLSPSFLFPHAVLLTDLKVVYVDFLKKNSLSHHTLEFHACKAVVQPGAQMGPAVLGRTEPAVQHWRSLGPCSRGAGAGTTTWVLILLWAFQRSLSQVCLHLPGPHLQSGNNMGAVRMRGRDRDWHVVSSLSSDALVPWLGAGG